MYKYLYLTKVEWADTWVNGGEIPIALASTYLGDTREGTTTPDENTIFKSKFPRPVLRQMGIDVRQSRDIVFRNYFMGDVPISHLEVSDYTEDGLILSFCNLLSESIARRLGKSACVKITEISALKQHIDSQLGCVSKMSKCLYTAGHERNHFLKSIDDSWQEEYRLFWRLREPMTVNIPKGFARLEAVY